MEIKIERAKTLKEKPPTVINEVSPLALSE